MELVHNTRHLVLVCPLPIIQDRLELENMLDPTIPPPLQRFLLVTQDWLELEDSLGTMSLPSAAPLRFM